MGLTGSMPVIILDTSQPHFGHPPCRAVPVKRSRSARGIPIPRPTLQQIHFGHPVAFPQLRETVSEDTVFSFPICPILSSGSQTTDSNGLYGQHGLLRQAARFSRPHSRDPEAGQNLPPASRMLALLFLYSPTLDPAFAGPASGGTLCFRPCGPH